MTDSSRPALITGGAGFIGTNLADRLLRDGHRVVVYDDFSRPCVERNFTALRSRWGERVQIQIADVRDPFKLHAAVRSASQVFHLAAHTRCGESIESGAQRGRPKLRAAMDVLEAARSSNAPPTILFAVSHLVYEVLSESALRQYAGRYEPHDDAVRRFGISESRTLARCVDSGSAGDSATDHAVLERVRESALQAAVLRLSGAYGPHQSGGDDRYWVAHAGCRALQKRPAIVRGDGMHVRDLLYIDDLIDAMLVAQRLMAALSGRAFNLGGGPARSATALDVIRVVSEVHGSPVPVQFEPWRSDDTRYWTADTRAFTGATGWSPRIELGDGIARTYRWLRDSAATDRDRVGAG